MPPDDSAPLSPQHLLFLQQVLGTLLFYARAVDNTLLVTLNDLASAQSNGTEAVLSQITQLLNYCATHPDAIV
jgi:type IV secretory pathway VirB2 component (pilin)